MTLDNFALVQLLIFIIQEGTTILFMFLNRCLLGKDLCNINKVLRRINVEGIRTMSPLSKSNFFSIISYLRVRNPTFLRLCVCVCHCLVTEWNCSRRDYRYVFYWLRSQSVQRSTLPVYGYKIFWRYGIAKCYFTENNSGFGKNIDIRIATAFRWYLKLSRRRVYFFTVLVNEFWDFWPHHGQEVVR